MVWAGMRHHWRAHAGPFAGAVLCAMVIVGSLLVGDSLRGTLHAQAKARVGRVRSALVGGERFFRAALAAEAGADAAPVILLRGSASHADGSARLNQVQILGVDSRFWALSLEGDRRELQPGDAVLSRALAARLGLNLGDSLIVRVEKPSAFSKDAPLSGEEDGVEALRAKVAAIADDSRFGRFSLQAAQVAPATVFLPLEQLQQRLDVSEKANLLLSSQEPAALRSSVAARWALADSSLEVRALDPERGSELRSSRVFLDDALVGVLGVLPAGRPSLTYFVNELRSGGAATPYSMVTAAEPGSSPFLPADLSAGEMVVSDWLAADLGVAAGAEVEVKYLVMNAKRQFEERSRTFRIRSVQPLGQAGWNGSWMPDFPGLADAGNCRDWKPGFALDTKRIRDKDEAYWKQHRGAPKAFISLEAGREMWSNRWGGTTAVRYVEGQAGETSEAVRRALGPEVSGMQFLALRELARAATDAPVDFAGLFLGFSFFLVLAALALLGLLFGLMVEGRVREAGTLLAMGWPVYRVRLLFLGEGCGVAVLGAVLGACAGVAYTRVILRALSGIWGGVTGGVHIVFHASRSSIAIGLVSAVAVALLAMLWVTRNSWKKPARVLLEGDTGVMEGVGGALGGGRVLKLAALVAAAGGGAMLASVLSKREVNPEFFFGGGCLLLVALLILSRLWLGRFARGTVRAIRQLAWRNMGRRPGRSAAIVAVLASGVFMVLSVQVFRKEAPQGLSSRDSGTGGFALIGELASPVYEDLNAAAVRDTLGLPAADEVRVHAVRVREGEDASCLNLNRAVRPRILGVPTTEWEALGVFRFVEKGAGWALLRSGGAGEVPVAVDEDTLKWALQKRVGDVLTLPDGRGGEVKLRIAASLGGSVLQGSLLVDEGAFVRVFPDAGGYRMLFLDAPASQIDPVRAAWSRALEDRGLDLQPASRRLAELQTVSNTYLAIFEVLGGLGVLLGTVGVGVVAARNAMERRAELAILEAGGWSRGQQRRLLQWELILLIFVALLIGGACAWMVTVPLQWLRGAVVGHRVLVGVLGVLGVVSVVSVRIALALGMRGEVGEVLRRE